MARYECVRCREVLNTTMPPHLCKDVQAGLEEAERHLAREACPPPAKRGGLDGWLKRMSHFDPKGRPPVVHEWVADHWGHLLDACHPRTS